MKIQYFKEYSECLGRDMEFKVFGHAGKPMLVFPCQDGRFFDFEDRGMVDIAGGFIDSRRTYLSGLTALLEKHNPSSELADRQRKLYEQKLKLEVFPERLERMKIEQSALALRLESVNPDNVLSRGYSYVESEDGNAIDSVAKVKAGQEVKIVFADGTAKSTIIDTSRKEG